MESEECVGIFERYVSGKASDREVARLVDWIKNNRELSHWLEQQIDNTSSNIDASLQYKMLRNIRKEVEQNAESGQSSGDRRKWWRVAAIIMLPLLTAIGMYLYMTNRNPADIPYTVAVEKGQKASVILQDGTKVWLNSKSKLVCAPRFNVKDRELNLNGEAYFEVAHNARKPFRVICNGIAVEALGTAFVVRAYDEDKIVSSVLVTGKVRVGTPDGETVLMPNERIEYDKVAHKKMVKHVTNASDFTGWRYNEMRFENESLGEIAETIERTYNIKLIFASADLANQRFTGTMNNSSLESVLNILALTSSLKFRIENQQVILSRK